MTDWSKIIESAVAETCAEQEAVKQAQREAEAAKTRRGQSFDLTAGTLLDGLKILASMPGSTFTYKILSRDEDKLELHVVTNLKSAQLSSLWIQDKTKQDDRRPDLGVDAVIRWNQQDESFSYSTTCIPTWEQLKKPSVQGQNLASTWDKRNSAYEHEFIMLDALADAVGLQGLVPAAPVVPADPLASIVRNGVNAGAAVRATNEEAEHRAAEHEAREKVAKWEAQQPLTPAEIVSKERELNAAARELFSGLQALQKCTHAQFYYHIEKLGSDRAAPWTIRQTLSDEPILVYPDKSFGFAGILSSDPVEIVRPVTKLAAQQGLLQARRGKMHIA